MSWTNWAATERVNPRRVERPSSPEAIQRAVVAAAEQGLPIKAVGSGHSFTGIAVAPGVQLQPEFRGLLGVNTVRRQARVAAGTRLRDLSRELDRHGLALQNMGDIDRQTIAGAVSTGTHGTGAAFGGLATQIVAATLVTGTGELLHVSESENPELLPAVRVGLGALGILVDVTLQCVPAFTMHADERSEPLDEVLDGFLERCATHDHFEFYWFPGTPAAQTKTNTRLGDAKPKPLNPVQRWIDDQLIGNFAFTATCMLSTVVPSVVTPVNWLATRLYGNRRFSDRSDRVFVSPREVRFREMEYALPRDAVPQAVRELRDLVARRGWHIEFPIEVRATAPDDNWLSTAYQRETGYVAIHRYWRRPHEEYFREAEAIFRAHAGRPHWGKMHSADAAQLRTLYPRFDDFLAVRDRLDPNRLFRNPYLERVLGA